MAVDMPAMASLRSSDYAALCAILLPGQAYTAGVASQLLAAMRRAVSKLEDLVAEPAHDNDHAAQQKQEGPFDRPGPRP